MIIGGEIILDIFYVYQKAFRSFVENFVEAVENSLPAGFAPFFRCGSRGAAAAAHRGFGRQKLIILCKNRSRCKVRFAPFPPFGKNFARFLAPPFRIKPAVAGL